MWHTLHCFAVKHHSGGRLVASILFISTIAFFWGFQGPEIVTILFRCKTPKWWYTGCIHFGFSNLHYQCRDSYLRKSNLKLHFLEFQQTTAFRTFVVGTWRLYKSLYSLLAVSVGDQETGWNSSQDCSVGHQRWQWAWSGAHLSPDLSLIHIWRCRRRG